MVAKGRKRTALSRKRNVPQAITRTKSMNEDRIINDALMYIYKLKVEMEALHGELMATKRQSSDQTRIPKGVKVEKVGEKLLLNIRCNRGENMLVSILEAFEEMGFEVLQAKVSSKNMLFSMEAIVVPQDQQEQALDVDDVTESLVKALGINQAG